MSLKLPTIISRLSYSLFLLAFIKDLVLDNSIQVTDLSFSHNAPVTAPQPEPISKASSFLSNGYHSNIFFLTGDK